MKKCLIDDTGCALGLNDGRFYLIVRGAGSVRYCDVRFSSYRKIIIKNALGIKVRHRLMTKLFIGL